MKLLNILARELKVWPDQYYQIFQDSGGNLHGSLSDGDLEDCDQEDLPGDPVTIAWDGNNAVVDRAEWQAAVDALNAPKVVEWDGVGLPPVGLLCERLWVSGGKEYVKVRVIAHDEGQAIFRFIEGKRNGSVQADAQGSGDQIGSPIFRPARTAAQVAAEERESGIQAIQDAYTYTVGHSTHKILHSQATRLYDAGCRLQVAP